jgi:molybdopterin-binding protein
MDLERQIMRLSARNVLAGKVKEVTPGAVDSEVVIEVAPGIDVVSVITKRSAEALKLKAGANVYAIIKASNVMVGVD